MFQQDQEFGTGNNNDGVVPTSLTKSSRERKDILQIDMTKECKGEVGEDPQKSS